MIKLILEIFSTDQLVCNTTGRLPTDYGSELSHRRFQGGTIYNDDASSLVWVENQVSLGSNETVIGNSRFRKWLYDQAAAEVS